MPVLKLEKLLELFILNHFYVFAVENNWYNLKTSNFVNSPQFSEEITESNLYFDTTTASAILLNVIYTIFNKQAWYLDSFYLFSLFRNNSVGGRWGLLTSLDECWSFQ